MLRLANRTPWSFSACFFSRGDGCFGVRSSSLLRGGGAVEGSVSRRLGHAFSSSAGGGFSQIPPEDIARLNRTSVSLYRLLLKECRDATRHASCVESGRLLLQPPFDRPDQGAVRWLDSRECSAWSPQPDATSEELGTRDEGKDGGKNASRVVDFFLRWTSEAESPLDEKEQDLTQRAVMLIARNIGLEHLDILPTKKSTSSGVHDDTKWEHILASSYDLSNAVRRAFLRISSCGEDEELRESLTKADIVHLHRRAINAMRLLHDQKELALCTTVTENDEKGIRVVATSRYNGYIPSNRHWTFAYRIRVENIRRKQIETDGKSDEGNDSCGDMQLLGRYWEIHELQDDGSDFDDNPTIVPAPSTGAVGHHPVIRPGQLFEYMSQAMIATPDGKMAGKFYMADVKKTTRSGVVGEPIEALRFSKEDERLFEANVGPFQLSVPISERVEKE